MPKGGYPARVPALRRRVLLGAAFGRVPGPVGCGVRSSAAFGRVWIRSSVADVPARVGRDRLAIAAPAGRAVRERLEQRLGRLSEGLPGGVVAVVPAQLVRHG